MNPTLLRNENSARYWVITIFIYTGFLACGILFHFNLLPHIWSRLVLAEEQWHPSLDLVAFADGSGFMFSFFILGVVSISFLVECYQASRSPGLRASAVWLIIRAGLVGLTAIAVFGASGTMLKARRIFEDRSVKWLSQLQHGMPRNDVEILTLKTNALLIRDPNRQNGINAKDNTEYQRVLYALENASQGQPVNWRVLDFHKVLFKLNLLSPPKKDTARRSVFVRMCCGYMFSWTRYDLLIEYDHENRLKSARYLRSLHGDGEARCSVLLEIPASKDKQYPYPCPPDVQDF